jgi:gentisate 1,2-dioxygenase
MSDVVEASRAPSNRDAALKALYDEMREKHLVGYWATTAETDHDEDRQVRGAPTAIPYHWSYAEGLEPILRRSAELITMTDSERRSVVLVNPTLAPRRATVSTLYTAYRLNDPNEVMPPHRHTASAVRLGLTGTLNFTGVEGEDITFGPGDLVLTPRDTWHNHGNLGDVPAVNLSILDLPLVEHLNALSFEHDYREGNEPATRQTSRFPSDYSARAYGAGGYRPRFLDHRRGEGDSSPMFVYRYEPMRELLEKHRDWDGSLHEGLAIEYVDPVLGGPVFKTMTFFMQMLRPGERTLPLSQTASLVVAPFEGRGYSIIDGKRFDWAPFDALAVPAGTWVEHGNASETEPAILFIASDEPALKAFGLLKRLGRTAAGEIVRLV